MFKSWGAKALIGVAVLEYIIRAVVYCIYIFTVYMVYDISRKLGTIIGLLGG